MSCRGSPWQTCWRASIDLASRGEKAQAYTIFAEVLPQIAYSLQHMELFHHAEKRLLEARGILETTNVRDAGIELRASDAEHIDFLNSRILALLDRLGMPHNRAGKADRSDGQHAVTTPRGFRAQTEPGTPRVW